MLKWTKDLKVRMRNAVIQFRHRTQRRKFTKFIFKNPKELLNYKLAKNYRTCYDGGSRIRKQERKRQLSIGKGR